jgi:hypothetical protein
MSCYVDVSNSANSKVPVLDISQLGVGTQVSVECLTDGVSFDHHGVFIGCLNPVSKESHKELLKKYPRLIDRPCVVDFNGNSVSSALPCFWYFYRAFLCTEV